MKSLICILIALFCEKNAKATNAELDIQGCLKLLEDNDMLRQQNSYLDKLKGPSFSRPESLPVQLPALTIGTPRIEVSSYTASNSRVE